MMRQGLRAAPRRAVAAAARRTFSIDPLPYPYNALAPTLSEETLKFHYDKHHTGYYNKLKAAAESRTELASKSNEEIILSEPVGSPVFNLAAQIYNHDFYWKSLSPQGGGAPTGALADKINADFGSFEKFQADFAAQAGGHFGSGWVWLVQDKGSKKLEIMQTHDAGCPITSNKQPIMTCDVWEHAFYVDYRNDKPTYVKNFWGIVNWQFASGNLL
eukprot:TRINITY_DN7467_c0_g1_i1.p1 TRINITY_DN7467_c0_g1~~TRINITY_DN7467_c0_g1_i1.p1  ORF type:complete len:246 (+),score=111.80 TRINITY_DN7467_c0_g1_i1:93-740(+)